MMDDIRNHDAMPSAEECAWMQDGIGALARTFALAALALVMVLGAGMLVDDADANTNVAVFGPR
jgi:hypothetical protein